MDNRPSLKASHGQNREIILEPVEAPAEYSLIWMHGLGDSAMGFYPVFASEETFLPGNFRVRLLTAPESAVTLNHGFRCNSWYDIISLDRTENSFSFKDVERNSVEIQKIIQDEIDLFQGDSTKVFIGGFSQGCAMALHNGLIFEKGLLGGIVGLSGYLFPQTKIPESLPPVFLSHGEDDSVVKFEFALGSYQRQNLLNRPSVSFHSQPNLDHSLDQQTLSAARRFVSKLVKIK